MASSTIINFSKAIENSYNILCSKHEKVYRNVSFDFTSYFAKYCYDLVHYNDDFISELKNIFSESIDFCNQVLWRIGIDNTETMNRKVQDLICKYSEYEFLSIINTGIWLKELYLASKNKFLDEELIKFLNSRYEYDYRKFDCLIMLIHNFHVTEKNNLDDSIIKAFDIMDICYGKNWINVFSNLEKNSTLSYNEFCEFFIMRSSICFKNKIFSLIDFKKLPEIYNSRKNKLANIDK